MKRNEPNLAVAVGQVLDVGSQDGVAPDPLGGLDDQSDNQGQQHIVSGPLTDILDCCCPAWGHRSIFHRIPGLGAALKGGGTEFAGVAQPVVGKSNPLVDQLSL